MPFVPVPKDLGKVKTKVALNLTKRQLICFGVAGAVGIPTYLITRTVIGSDVAVLLMIGLMLPFFFFAMYEKDGQPAEQILRNRVRAKLWPKHRPYKTENLYQTIQRYSEECVSKTPSESRGARGGTGPAREAHRRVKRAMPLSQQRREP